jgi:LmbE family N-acetylglucosaminyl deacetylase
LGGIDRPTPSRYVAAVIRLGLGDDSTRPLHVLCIGAHSDDIEIGCGGTMLRLLAERPGCRVHWVVLSADAHREKEARQSAADFLADAADAHVEIKGFRESYFPFEGSEIKDFFNDLRRRVDPQLVLCHHRFDEHQDHRMVAELTWNTFRSHLIAEYEIPKYEGDLGRPNLFVDLPAWVAERKVELIVKHFGTQHDKYWFRPETFAGLMALRGVEAGSAAAEGFHVRKLVI